MSSDELLKFILRPTNIGYKLKCLPYYWNRSTEQPLLLKSSNKHPNKRMLWLLLSASHIYVRLTLIGILLSFDALHSKTFNIQLKDMIVFYYACIIWSFSTIIQLNSFLFPTSAQNIINATLKFVVHLRKIHKMDANEDKTIIRCLKIVTIGGMALTILTFLFTFMLIYSEYFGMQLTNNNVSFSLQAFALFICTFIASFMSFLTTIDLIHMLHFGTITILYYKVVLGSMKASRWTPGISSQARSILQSAFAAHQILHNLFIQWTKNIFACTLSLLEIVLILAITCLISFYDQLSVMTSCLFGGSAVLIIIVLVTGLEYCALLKETTKEFPASYLRNEISLTKCERKVYKSFQCLSIHAGVITISKETILVIIGEVIFESVVDLLLTFRETQLVE